MRLSEKTLLLLLDEYAAQVMPRFPRVCSISSAEEGERVDQIMGDKSDSEIDWSVFEELPELLSFLDPDIMPYAFIFILSRSPALTSMSLQSISFLASRFGNRENPNALTDPLKRLLLLEVAEIIKALPMAP